LIAARRNPMSFSTSNAVTRRELLNDAVNNRLKMAFLAPKDTIRQP